MKRSAIACLFVAAVGCADHSASIEGSVAEPLLQAQLTYYGGKVISNVKIQIINWGNGVTNAAQLPGFYTAITNSAYLDWLTEYNTATQTIGRGTYLGSYTDQASTGSTITDAAIQNEITRLIAAGSIPANDNNTLYMVYFPPGKTISHGGAISCQDFCAYHGTFKRNLTNVYYGVFPDLGGACATGCGVHDQFGNTCSSSSQEMASAITDPEVGLATGLAAPLAWYDQTNGEIGDICAGSTDGMVGGYVVQSLWSNASHACIVTKSADFSVALAPATNTVVGGTTTTYTVTTAATSGASTVALSATGLPTGVAASFNPASVAAGSSSTLTLTADAGAPATPATTFTVSATDGITTHTATATVTVTAADFSFTPAMTSISVNGGESTMVAVNTTAVAGAAGPITFTASGLPTGVTVSFTPTSVAVGSSSMMTIAVDATAAPVTAASFTITGVSGTVTHAAMETLSVVSADYVLFVDPAALSIHVGSTGQVTVHGSASIGIPAAFGLTAASLPANVTALFDPMMIAPGESSTLQFSVGANATPGTTSVLVVGNDSISHSATVSLTIVGDPPPAPDAGVDAPNVDAGSDTNNGTTGDHGGGCSAGAGGSSGVAMVVAMAMLRRRRRV